MSGPFTFGDIRVDVLGDSYAVGTTLTDPKHEAWGVLSAEREHWDLRVHGVGRTGFVNGGYCGDQTFGSRVAEVLADDPRLVIVEGGLNDAGQSGVGPATQAVLAMMPASVCVVVVGPTDAPGRSGSDKSVIDREIAEAAGSLYISPLDWRLEFGTDGIHMTAKGNETFAEDLVSAIAPYELTCRK